MSFAHLHVHTQYSILDGLSNIKKLFERAEELKLSAVAITDHGNLYGVKEFLKVGFSKNKQGERCYHVKPIIGCEVYVTRHYDNTIKDKDHRKYYHLVLLAKNYNGYKNLMKICSEGHINGKYNGKPRVTHEFIEQNSADLICLSACIAGEVPFDIINGDMEGARKAIQWHKDVFGDNYYLEVQLHQTELVDLPAEAYDRVIDTYNRQRIANNGIFDLAEEMGVKVVATNDVHFVMKEDGPAHDRLICLTTNSSLSEVDRMRYTQQEYLKSEEEMLELFPRHPEVISMSGEIADRIEEYKIDRGHVLPKYEIAPEFLADIDSYLEKYKEVIDEGRCDKEGNYRGDEFCYSVAYLCYLTYEGARKRYGETLNEEQAERIDFELKTICRMGFPDYFLIVQDYIAACRAQGSLVGPGRGSAAGSVVAYCLKITNLDPIKYSLLFERFLNPDRISMPDIDVDFEDLSLAHKYVEEKYSSDHVSRVITFGTMAAKSAIKDVARISELSIEESNRLSGMVPDRLSEKVEKEYPYNPKLDELKKGFTAFEKEVEVDDPDVEGGKKLVKKMYQKGLEEVDAKINLKNCYRLVPEFQEELQNGSEKSKEVLKYAQMLEGSIRQVGMHACATIIGRGNLTDYIPICLSVDKESGEEVWTSQYDGHYIEDVGMLKMDFLGLNTLSIIHMCLDMIKERFGVDIDIEAIPIDDAPTYELYGRGDTTSVFQFESPGMKEWLQKLHPERFEDLIAMNALYRPGPMDYIPSFVERKLGHEEISYDLPEMEEFLKETYGVTVYQEQVMLLSRKLADFTKGEADKLRKAMGKKLIDVLNSLKDKFMTGGMKNGHPEKVLDKIWKDWEKFAQYAFNKSHATCYAWVSYQTGWLKCHYPAEFQAANLSCNLSKGDEIKKIMADCKKNGIKVLNPDINESGKNFSVNHDGHIRFGLGGIKGFGDNVVNAILDERGKNGPFLDIHDFIERMAGMVNKSAFDALIDSGAFDGFGIKRSQFRLPAAGFDSFADAIIRYGELFKKDSLDCEFSLFGDTEEMKPARPEIPAFDPNKDNLIDILHREKEKLTMYLSAHPLDRYSFELENFTTIPLSSVQEFVDSCYTAKKNGTATIAGYISASESAVSRTGKPWGKFTLEDMGGSLEMSLFGKDYETFKQFTNKGDFVLIEGSAEPSYRPNPDDKNADVPYKFKTKKMILLGNAIETYMKSFHITVLTTQLNESFRKSLVTLLKKNKGGVPLGMYVIDPKTRYRVEFLSKKFSVAITNEFLDGLKSLNINYSVVKK